MTKKKRLMVVLVLFAAFSLTLASCGGGGGGVAASSSPVVTTSCGNGVKEGLEQCDDGNTVTEVCAYGQTSCTVCSNSCQSVSGATAYCGDGTKNGNEGCDDGNKTNGDGCSSTCSVETATPVCGNGTREASEQCDDGNVVNGDGCSSTCQTETITPTAVCGNGTKETGEVCDDGNTVTETCAYGQTSCTVCSATCQSVAGATSYCGDGICSASQGETTLTCQADCGGPAVGSFSQTGSFLVAGGAVGITSYGNKLAITYSNGATKVYSPDGVFLGDATFSVKPPTVGTISAGSFCPNGDMIMADRTMGIIDLFVASNANNYDFPFVRSFGQGSPALLNPSDIACDSNNDKWVIDRRSTGSVKKFVYDTDKNQEKLQCTYNGANQPGSGIVAGKDGKVYVTNQGNDRIDIIGPKGSDECAILGILGAHVLNSVFPLNNPGKIAINNMAIIAASSEDDHSINFYDSNKSGLAAELGYVEYGSSSLPPKAMTAAGNVFFVLFTNESGTESNVRKYSSN